MEGAGAQERVGVERLEDFGAPAELDSQFRDPATTDRVQKTLRAHQVFNS